SSVSVLSRGGSGLGLGLGLGLYLLPSNPITLSGVAFATPARSRFTVAASTHITAAIARCLMPLPDISSTNACRCSLSLTGRRTVSLTYAVDDENPRGK